LAGQLSRGKEHQLNDPTFDQELTGRYVAAGGDRPDLDARRAARAVLVRDTIRTVYNADKKLRTSTPRRQPRFGRARRRRRRTPRAHRQRRQPAISDVAAKQQRRTRMRTHHSALGGPVLVLALLLTGCSDDPTADPTSPTTPPTTTSSSPTESTSPTTEPETPKQKAIRLATVQTKAYIRTYERLYANPDLPLDILDKYANTQALLETKSAIQQRRVQNQRLVGHSKIIKTWLGPEKVVFNQKAPMAVVDLYVCYDLNGSHFVDQQGNPLPQTGPQVAQVRYAIYADSWPNESSSNWRVGKEFGTGEPCAR
jgi:hypothetical protein